jgi:hypothetical protein
MARSLLEAFAASPGSVKVSQSGLTGAKGTSMESTQVIDISDVDRDSLHILPLAILPLQTAGLRRARMVKNVYLDSVIELFIDRQTGSGQVAVESIPREFGWPPERPHPDLIMLTRLAQLPSYDVYSLRIQLRNLNITVKDVDALKLSETMSKQLTNYMKSFTRPLIGYVYGGDDVSIQDIDDVIRLFKDPDVKKAQEKLRQMASKLSIEVKDIPKFLEDYGDIFLSLSYYRQCLESISPVLDDFFLSLDDIRGNWQLKHDSNLIKTCETLKETLNDLVRHIRARFDNFDRASNLLWENITAERFRRMEKLVQSHHITIGGMLCALTVKMDAWVKPFPSRKQGGPMKRAEFIMSELREGIEKMQELAREARKSMSTQRRA